MRGRRCGRAAYSWAVPLAEPLSERELQVLRMMAGGLSNQEIAGRLFVAEGTVKKHTHNIFSKLGVRSRIQAVIWASEAGLLGG